MNLKEFEKLRYALQLAEFVIDEKQWATICDKKSSRDEINKMTHAIEEAAMKTILAWEVETGIKPKSFNMKKVRAKGYFVGLGLRVKKYKGNQKISLLEKLKPPNFNC
mmetsp:Transcript_12411/g.31341  ORF Transcript_12411/g.31341 Transcript_12411/m.31341 type:complete len:108 (-) Transcript_12411:130-453(-)